MYILILPFCHSCTYFNQNKCVQSEIERRGLLVQVSLFRALLSWLICLEHPSYLSYAVQAVGKANQTGTSCVEIIVLGAERGRRSEKSSSSICGEENEGKL